MGWGLMGLLTGWVQNPWLLTMLAQWSDNDLVRHVLYVFIWPYMGAILIANAVFLLLRIATLLVGGRWARRLLDDEGRWKPSAALWQAVRWAWLAPWPAMGGFNAVEYAVAGAWCSGGRMARFVTTASAAHNVTVWVLAIILVAALVGAVLLIANR